MKASINIDPVIIFGLIAAGIYIAGRYDWPFYGRLLKYGMARNPGKWEYWPLSEPPEVPERYDGLMITQVNHASALIQADGMNIMTDPLYKDRVHNMCERHQDYGIKREELPPVDVVLISHNHGDHYDLDTLRFLARRDNPVIIAPMGTAYGLISYEIDNVMEMQWWQRVIIGGLDISFVPSQHWTTRYGLDYNSALWGSYIIHTSETDRTLYVVGDTGYNPHLFEGIKAMYGPPDITLMPIGAYKPYDVFGDVHISPEQAVMAHKILESRLTLANHWGVYPQGDVEQEEPLRELARLYDAGRISPEEFVPLINGDQNIIDNDGYAA